MKTKKQEDDLKEMVDFTKYKLQVLSDTLCRDLPCNKKAILDEIIENAKLLSRHEEDLESLDK